MGPPTQLRASALLVLALTTSACGDAAAPVIPIDRPTASVLLETSIALNLQVCVADALERIAPALGSSNDVSKITNALALISVALGVREPALFTVSARSFHSALDEFFEARPERVADPEAAVLRLLLDDLEAVALNPPLDTLRTP